MLFSYFSLLLACGLAFGDILREHTPEQRMRILGPLAFYQSGSNGRLDFPCTAFAPSPTVPTSAHAVRPADIKYIAAMGDSLTAANGAKALTIIALLVEYRGVSWSIGGDSNLNSVVTLSNILRKFNDKLTGFSTGTGNRDQTNSALNVAKAGAISSDMPDQAVILVNRFKTAMGANVDTDWKLITFFIGGNDLCAFCKDTNRYSAANYVNNIKTALDYLQANLKRAIVNFVTVLNVAELEDLHEGLVCQGMQGLLCDCAINKNTREQVRAANLEYQKVTNALIDSGVYDSRDDFTVIRQPFMEHMKVPQTPAGDADFSYFAPDCFHFSRKGHEAAAIELWNNMMQKVGQKTTLWNLEDTLYCPAGDGYIYTSKNSK